MLLSARDWSMGLSAVTPQSWNDERFELTMFFFSCCSEDSCRYRYQFDNLIELTADWEAVVANGMEGHVTVAQVSEDLEENKAKLQISVFLTVSSR